MSDPPLLTYQKVPIASLKPFTAVFVPHPKQRKTRPQFVPQHTKDKVVEARMGRRRIKKICQDFDLSYASVSRILRDWRAVHKL